MALPGLIIAAGLALLFAHEAWTAGTNPEPYQFGSESMIAKGGREYSSATAYMLSAGLSVALSLASIAFLLRGVTLSHRRLIGVGYVFLLAAPTVSRLL